MNRLSCSLFFQVPQVNDPGEWQILLPQLLSQTFVEEGHIFHRFQSESQHGLHRLQIQFQYNSSYDSQALNQTYSFP